MKAQIDASELKRLINSTKQFASHDDARRIYNYIRLEITEHEIKAVAVDGYHLAVEYAECTCADEPFTAYIKLETLKCRKDDIAEIEVKDGFCYIRIGDNVLGYRQPQGEFLDYETALQTANKPPAYRIGFNVDLLIDALKSIKASDKYFRQSPVEMEFHSPTEPIVLRTGEKNIRLVLPVRLRNKEE